MSAPCASAIASAAASASLRCSSESCSFALSSSISASSLFTSLAFAPVVDAISMCCSGETPGGVAPPVAFLVISYSWLREVRHRPGREARRERARMLDAREEGLVEDDRAVERLPRHDAGLVQAIALVGPGEVVELGVLEDHLAVALVPDHERREDRDAGRGRGGRGLRGADTREDHRRARGQLGGLAGERTRGGTRRAQREVGRAG